MQAFNTHPDHMSIKELVAYGEDHSDPWVKKLAFYADMFPYYVPNEYRNDPDEWFEANEIELREKESALSWAEEVQHEAEERAEQAEYQYNALLLDRDVHELVYQNNALKSRLREEQLKNERLRNESIKDQELYCALEKKHKHLIEKYNTWTIIAT